MTDHNTVLPASPENLLKVYGVYRFLLSLLLLVLFYSDVAENVIGQMSPKIFLYITLCYVILAGASLLSTHFAGGELNIYQRYFILTSDIAIITLLMHYSGGVSSGLGYLMLVVVAAGSIMLKGRISLLLAAVASLCVIGQATFNTIVLNGKNDDIFPAGLLGILLFLTAIIFQTLTQRAIAAQSFATEKAIETSKLEALNASIIERMRTGIMVVDENNNIELVNSAATQLLSRSKSQCAAGASITQAPMLAEKLRHWRENPSIRPAPFKAKATGQQVQANFAELQHNDQQRTLIFLEDHRALAQRAQQLKLSSLGRLTGSIAHEIRNPLSAISHASQLLKEQQANNIIPDPANNTQIDKLTDIIYRHCQRVNQIIENVLQLSRRGESQQEMINLQSWLEDFKADYLLGKSDTTLELSLSNQDINVRFDTSQLRQILTNLVDNATRYSFDNTGQAWAKITTAMNHLSDLPLLEVYDLGTGIPDENRDQVFEPFFTTASEGSGLGLFLARELCEANYATLNYISFNNNSGKNEHQPSHCFRIGFAHHERLISEHTA